MFLSAESEAGVSADEAGAALWAAAITARKLGAGVTAIVRRVPGRVSLARHAGRANGVAVQVELGSSSLVIRFAGDGLTARTTQGLPTRVESPPFKRGLEAHVS